MIVQFAKLNENAEMPSSSNDAVGYDLKVLNVKKVTNVPIWEVSHGIAVVPPEGFYFELVARSSLHKEGYMLANSVGIIDPDYRGDIIAKAYKFREDAKPLVKGESYFQLILHRREFVCWFEISPDDLDETNRGANGFGSTKPFANKTVTKPETQQRTTTNNNNSARRPPSKQSSNDEEALDEQFDETPQRTTSQRNTQRKSNSKPQQQYEEQQFDDNEEQFEEQEQVTTPPKRTYNRKTTSKPLESEPQTNSRRPPSKPLPPTTNANEDNFDDECEEQQQRNTRTRPVPSRQTRASK